MYVPHPSLRGAAETVALEAISWVEVYYAENKEHIKAISKKYYSENEDFVKAKYKAKYHDDIDASRAKANAYYAANKVQIQVQRLKVKNANSKL